MFSRNGKISEKQMRRMLVLSVFASSIFVIPYLSARLFKTGIFPGLLVFCVFSCIYVSCIYGIGAWYEKKGDSGGFVKVLEDTGAAGKGLLLLQVIRLLIRLAFYIILAISILGEAQVPFMQEGEQGGIANLFVVLPLLLAALYGANRNVEKQGRIHEMIFWVLFVPFIVVILFGLREVDYRVFVPHWDVSFRKLVLYGYALLTFILPVENYLYLRPVLQKRKTTVKKEKAGDGTEQGSTLYGKRQNLWVSYTAVLMTILLTVVLTLFLLGIYGVNGAGKEEMVTIAIMRYIRLPFGVLERFDVLMVWFFMTGCFILICTTLYYAGFLLKLLCKKIKRIWLLAAVLAVSLGIVMSLPEYSGCVMLFLFYGVILDIPLSLVIPLLGIGLSKQETEEEEV